jgi:hypothetical protein
MIYSPSPMFRNFNDYADALWLTLQIASIRDIAFADLPEGEIVEKVNDLLIPDDNIISEVATEKSKFLPSSQQVVVNLLGSDKMPGAAYESKERLNFAATISQIPKSNFSKIQFHRAIKPLKRKFPSAAAPRQIDIDETLNQLAKNIIAIHTYSGGASKEKISIRSDIPVFTVGKERWLDLILVVDESLPMRFFQEQIRMTFNAFEESGIFRSIETFYINEKISDNGFPRPVLYKRNYLNQFELSCNISHLIASSERRVILFLSSCTSRMWHDWTILEEDENGPSIGNMMYEVCKHHPVAILQMLPERLWLRSGISYFEYCKASALTPAAPNTKLLLNVKEGKKKDFAIPILSLDSQRILAWSKMISGKADSPVLAMYIPKKYTSYQRDINNINTTEGELKERVQVFLSTAPKQARQFAGYLSVMLDLTEQELDEVARDFNSKPSPELVTDLTVTGLFESKSDVRTSKEIIFSFSGELTDRIPLWSNISFSERLEGMSYYYEFIANPSSKFYDNEGQPISFWVYLDNRETRNKNIAFNDEVGKQMFDLFEAILDWGDGRILEPLKAPNGLDNSTSNAAANFAKENDTSSNQLDNDVFVEPKKFDFSQARLIQEQDYSYLSLPLLNIGVWGESGVGKTSFLMSMSRDLIIKEPFRFTLSVVDHYGNLSAHPNAYIKPEGLGSSAEEMSTKKPKDYLMALDETSASKGKTRQLFCFHDFPGVDSVDITRAVDITYSNCDALFLFFSADKVISPTPQDKSNVTKNVSALMTWLQNKQSNIKLKYIVLIVAKLDLKASVLANAETPLDYMGKYLGTGVIQALKNRVGKIFVTSSLGVSKEDWIPQNTSLPILWLLEQEAKRKL